MRGEIPYIIYVHCINQWLLPYVKEIRVDIYYNQSFSHVFKCGTVMTCARVLLSHGFGFVPCDLATKMRGVVLLRAVSTVDTVSTVCTVFITVWLFSFCPRFHEPYAQVLGGWGMEVP